ncbi:MAG: hypothetical protein K6F86_00730 [Lachnospiraceae bacterium]|nr:hypothetical protein [Lachnospiraceae bacterium]
MLDDIRKLTDDEPDVVSGGVWGPSYTPDLLSNSGVAVKNQILDLIEQSRG